MKIQLTTIFIIFITALNMSTAQVPMENAVFNKSNLFKARTEGYYTYRIPGMVITTNGYNIGLLRSQKRRKW